MRSQRNIARPSRLLTYPGVELEIILRSENFGILLPVLTLSSQDCQICYEVDEVTMPDLIAGDGIHLRFMARDTSCERNLKTELFSASHQSLHIAQHCWHVPSQLRIACH